MTSGAPWSVKGIDPRAREVAKELAARAGMTLGEWLNRSILEGEAPALAAGAPRPPPNPVADAADPFDRPEADLRRLTQVLDRLADRLEGSEARTGAALARLEQSVRTAFGRLETTAAPPPRPEPRADRYEGVLRALEAALGRLAGQMREGEDRTREVLDGFRVRLERAESRPAAASGAEQVAIRIGEIQDRTAAAMNALHEAFGGLDQRLSRLEASAGEGVESRLREVSFRLGERLDAAREEIARDLTQTSGRRIDELERSVSDLAEKIRRVELSVEAEPLAGANAVRRPTEEADRIGEILASRLSRADPAQAASVARLGEEIARIGDRLGARPDRPGGDPAEPGAWPDADAAAEDADITRRIRESEDRTARLLQEARQRLDAHFPRPAAPVSPDPAVRLADEESRLLSLFDDEAEPEPTPAREASGTSVAAAEIAEARGDDWPLDLLAAARAANARGSGDTGPDAEPEAPVLPGFDLSPSRPVIRPRRFAGPGLASLAIFCISVSLVGYGVLSVLDRPGEASGPAARSEPGVLAAAPRGASAGDAKVRAAVALTPPPAVTPASTLQAQAQPAVRPAPPPAAAGTDARYRKAQADLKAGRPAAAAEIRALAEAGHGPSMALLSQLHAKGEAGVARDPALARSWLRRAAETGDRVSMHLYGVALMEGQDGPRDPDAAVGWFRRAAEAGLVDSQFNLGVVYERGMSVPRDLRQAFVWYSRAADSGDGEALRSVERLRPALTAAASVSAEDIRLAQKALGRLGYFAGPADGAASPQFRAAVEAYQKDQKAPATGLLDDATLKRLAMLGR